MTTQKLTQFDNLKEELRLAHKEINELKHKLYVSENSWNCFHCGVTFKTPGAAEDHFGARENSTPKCKWHDMDIEKLESKLAKVEKELTETDAWRVIHKKELTETDAWRVIHKTGKEDVLRALDFTRKENAELKAKVAELEGKG